MTLQPCYKLVAFLQLDTGDRRRWLCDRRLEKYLTNAGYELGEPHTTAIQLFQNLQNQPHNPAAPYWRQALFCYLQETSWSVAMKLRDKVAREHQLADCFQQACYLTSDPLKLLRGFNPQRGTRLSTYAYRRIYDRVYDALVGTRQSDWGLLKQAGRRRLASALQLQGYPEHHVRQIERLVYLWQNLVAEPAPPDQGLLGQLAQTYSQCCRDLPPLAPSQVETLLRKAIAALRASQVVHTAEQRFWDTLELEGEANSPWEAILKQEEQETLKRVFEMLKNAVEALDDASRQVFCLYYCEQVSQEQIARQLGFEKQYQVSRELERIRGHLAKEVLLAFNQPANTQHLKEVTAVVNLWLEEGYKEPAVSCQRCGRVSNITRSLCG
ncbi:sigma-70 family RNA polymerase sigma factor [Thermosynechococcus sp. HN-54]|uniref:sigma-70 family RNA polymerase sigma factor n=1 Tax=Thermosynechococcus sp. HN-54 TaxID=2933959 RepID=UPI00202CE4F0|nr:sigma-70 family RNA polymerase sigma factor [Thermosynechococcus sp. HN-54]URR36544.1 sigma-70 family RNA polymerase sigma factor [Thermosynechococcus sp. HN-54]